MLDILESSGYDLASRMQILDFGCGAGRMIRHLKPFSQACTIWGTEIDARSIYWCQQYLNPPFHFFTGTTIPHLPFQDGAFDLIYAGSVFTHIDDLAEAWLLEMRRVLSPEGRLYVTLHDRHTMKLFETEYQHTWLAQQVNSNDFYRSAKDTCGKIVLDRDHNSQIFYDIGYFARALDPVFEVISVNPEAYDYQTAVLMKPK